MKTKKLAPISHIVMMGDSLSDRGTMNKRYLFGFIPMSWLSGLAHKSPSGRFTNGLTWSDALSAKIINKFIVDDFREDRRLKKKTFTDSTDVSDSIINKRPARRASRQLNSSDIAEAIIANDKHTDNYGYNLHNNLGVQYQGLHFVRHYVEGGLTSHDYSWLPSTSLSRFFSRIILSTLDQQRAQLLRDDATRAMTRKQKAETLVIEWSGANDLITVNERPSLAEADDAIKARINNAIELIKNGYRHIVLINLPNLAFTPRYRNQKTARERSEAKYVSDYFNEQLALKCRKLQSNYPYCSIQIYDINSIFSKLYKDPEKFGLDKKKIKQAYTDSPEFCIKPNRTSPSKGFMFFDDVHPTAEIHNQLAEKIYGEYTKKYLFTKPKVEAVYSELEHIKVEATDLLACFRRKYENMLVKNRNGFFGKFCISNINHKTASIEDILKHALYENGHRTKKVITELQWIDKSGNICLNIPLLKEAMANVNADLSL